MVLGRNIVQRSRPRPWRRQRQQTGNAVAPSTATNGQRGAPAKPQCPSSALITHHGAHNVVLVTRARFRAMVRPFASNNGAIWLG
eukprot:3138041-Lingulodinium_polyedra.AAC.1